MEGTLRDYNKTVEKGLRVKILTMNEFRVEHVISEKKDLDYVVAHIGNVIKHEHGYKIIFKNRTSLMVFYDGHFQKNNDKPIRHLNKGRVRINNIGNYGYNASITPEKIIGICDCILRNELPSSFKNLVVNVMDGSGSDKTCEELGLKYNIHEENLEWTNSDRNFIYHGRAISKIYKKLGKVYRFSANDSNIFDAIATNNYKWVDHYLMMNYKRIK